MTLKATLFTDEYEALGAWTGQSRDELVALEGHHDGQRDLWLAWEDGKVVGAVRPWLRPDGKVVLYFSRCAPDAYPVLVTQVSGECYTTIDGEDTALLRRLEGLGFQVERTEYLYEIPVTLVDAPTPAGLEIISAADTELEKLMALDCALSGSARRPTTRRTSTRRPIWSPWTASRSTAGRNTSAWCGSGTALARCPDSD